MNQGVRGLEYTIIERKFKPQRETERKREREGGENKINKVFVVLTS